MDTPRSAVEPDSLRRAFDPEQFRAQGHALIDQLADHLAQAQAGAMPVLPWSEPEEEAAQWPADFSPEPRGTLSALVARVLARSTHLHHPRFIGHQVTSPLPDTALLELVSALLNNGMTVFEMGPVATAMERSVLRWLATQAGLGSAAEGVLTSGGSAGNLTALLAARQAKAGHDAWGRGAHEGRPLALLASEQTHYCVKRAAQIMGMGEGGVIPVPVDERFRMRADALEDAQRKAERAGRKVFAVVGSAGSTSTGAFDPLDEIADYCESRGLWFHVDGAHGAPTVLSEKYRARVRGIERADSLVWDAHKMMLLPALVTAVLFKDGARSYETFAQEAHYLYAPRAGNWFDGGLRTLECTKRMMSLELYGALELHGTHLFADYLTRMFDLAETFAGMLREAPDFVLAVEPDCNIVCFRYHPQGARDLDLLQSRVREALLKSGEFYLVQTKLPAGIYLRVTLINPLTEERDLRALLKAIREGVPS